MGCLAKPASATWTAMARAVSLDFPAEFRREIGQTRRLLPGGGVQVDPHYEYPAGEPGDYEVLWKAVWFVTSGTFAAAERVHLATDIAHSVMTSSAPRCEGSPQLLGGRCG